VTRHLDAVTDFIGLKCWYFGWFRYRIAVTLISMIQNILRRTNHRTSNLWGITTNKLKSGRDARQRTKLDHAQTCRITEQLIRLLSGLHLFLVAITFPAAESHLALPPINSFQLNPADLKQYRY
jgi:hypothetical protein